jgi:hypothetical protein
LAGSLTIVGLGPARPEHLTREATEVLRAAARSGCRVYGLAHARQLVAAVAPGVEVRSLDYLYSLPGVDRPTAYQDLAGMLVRKAFSDGVDVVYTVAGSPLFVNDAVLRIRQECAARALPLRLVHGISFLDLVLERVFWTGHTGLQLLSAWNIAVDGTLPDSGSPTLVFQLGESSAEADALDPERSTTMLVALRDALAARYPPDHPAILLSSTGHPDYETTATPMLVRDLAASPVPVYSNLWLPAVGGPPVEAMVAPGNHRLADS